MKYIEGYEAGRAAILLANAQRAFSSDPALEARVRATCDAVRAEGDTALLETVRRFDCATLELADLRVRETEIEAAWEALEPTAQGALTRAAGNIRRFHEKQPCGSWFTSTPDGSLLGQRFTPIERVGLYAPNGRAAYPSTVLMLAMPARVAGVPGLVLATPAGPDGNAHPVILASARVAGITEIYKVGGAAAMAALAFGTETVPKVDKIVGPGSIYVTLAKKYLYGTVGIDGLYGPSEVTVVADAAGKSAEEAARLADQVAADLLAQAEHGPDSFVCLIAPDAPFCAAVRVALEARMVASPRAAILRESLAGALIIAAGSMAKACELADLTAAEHVEIWSRDALAWSRKIGNAGAIFLNTPVPLGDYIAGPSHTLPTGATARYAAGVGVDTFLKRTSIVAASPEGLRDQADALETIALLEDLPGHAAAVRLAAK